MKYLYQAGIIFLFTFLGEALTALIPLPIPAAIWGLILLFAALCAKLIRIEQIRESAAFLTALLPALFVAPAVNLMDQARAGLERLYTARNNAEFALDHAPERAMNEEEEAFAQRAQAFIDRFDDAMCDDLNTSEAMGVLFEFVRDMNTSLSDAKQPCRAAIEEGLSMLNVMGHEVLGLLMKEADTVPDIVKALVQARVEAKKARNFAEADRLRGEVLAMGYVIEDTPKGPKVKKA